MKTKWGELKQPSRLHSAGKCQRCRATPEGRGARPWIMRLQKLGLPRALIFIFHTVKSPLGWINVSPVYSFFPRTKGAVASASISGCCAKFMKYAGLKGRRYTSASSRNQCQLADKCSKPRKTQNDRLCVFFFYGVRIRRMLQGEFCDQSHDTYPSDHLEMLPPAEINGFPIEKPLEGWAEGGIAGYFARQHQALSHDGVQTQRRNCDHGGL